MSETLSEDDDSESESVLGLVPHQVPIYRISYRGVGNEDFPPQSNFPPPPSQLRIK